MTTPKEKAPACIALAGAFDRSDRRAASRVARLAALRNRLLQLLEPAAAASQVAVAVLHVLVRVGQLLQAAEDVAAREILLGVTEIFTRHAEVLGGFTEVTTVVAAMVMMAVVIMMAMMVGLVIEQIIQETSEERCGKKWQHAILHCR